MAEPVSNRPRISVDGKFFRRGAGKFYLKGVAYGPFAPDASGQPFASPDQTAKDFLLARELGANLLRIYHVPPRWFLDLAAAHDLLLLIDIPWNKHLCFLDSAAQREAARDAVRKVVSACAHHAAVFAYSVANEIPPDIARWSGAARVADFIDELVLEARRIDPECLCTFANYPPTEFLRPQTLDFICFNVYLHQPQPFKNYLARLQMMADAKPLVLGEFGIDSLREGEPAKCEMLSWQIELAFRAGLAGTVVFSFTDDWHRGGQPVLDWKLGLTTTTREKKDSFSAVQKAFRAAPHFPLPRTPKVSVVVASYNGDRTLTACLESLTKLNYPDYEVILVDDGSTDTTPQLAQQFRWAKSEIPPGPETAPQQLVISAEHGRFRYFRHATNLGLSVARNTGIAAATGELIAFTDSDCRADEDWLFYLVGDLVNSEFAGMGGPNLLPLEDSAVASAVMVSPGGPAHVMLTDREAEHIPGCNMAFYKAALNEIGGFDHLFARAGDDVDVCWRLQQAGDWIAFAPGAFVWHHRRQGPRAYLHQQVGYGEAEALLRFKHPDRFNSRGDGKWRGVLYGASLRGLRFSDPIIYSGTYGAGLFQCLYRPAPAHWAMLPGTLEWHMAAALVALAAVFWPAAWFGVAQMLTLSFGVALLQALQARIAPRHDGLASRLLVLWLCYAQPLVRSWSRYRTRLFASRSPGEPLPGRLAPGLSLGGTRAAAYWSEDGLGRLQLLGMVVLYLNEHRWGKTIDSGWDEWDLEVHCHAWTVVRIATTEEDHGGNKRLVRVRYHLRAGGYLRLLALLALLAGGVSLGLLDWSAGAVALGLGACCLAAWWRGTRRAALAVTVVNRLAGELAMVSCDPSGDG